MPAIQAARPAATRPWRERLWEQDDWAWLLALLVALLAIRLMVLVLARTDLLFDEAQYWTWSRDLDFGYFTKPPLIASITRLATDVCGNAEWCVRAFGLHLGAALVITLGPIFAPEITKITGPDWNPYARVLGRRGLAATTRRLAEQQGGHIGAHRQPRSDWRARLLPSRYVPARLDLVARRTAPQSVRDHAPLYGKRSRAIAFRYPGHG